MVLGFDGDVVVVAWSSIETAPQILDIALTSIDKSLHLFSTDFKVLVVCILYAQGYLCP